MITNYQSGNWQLWLTSFIATIGVWTYFESSAFAQNATKITINIGSLIVSDNTSIEGSNDVFSSGASLNPGSIVLNTNDALSSAINSDSNSGGESAIKATDLVKIGSGSIVPSVIGGLLSAVSSGSGSAGTVSINVGNLLIVHDGTSISVDPDLVSTNNTSGSSLNLGGNLTIIGDNVLIQVNPSPMPSAGNSNTNQSGGEIRINAGEIRLEVSDLILTNRPRAIPELSSTLSLLAFAVGSAASVYKLKGREFKSGF